MYPIRPKGPLGNSLKLLLFVPRRLTPSYKKRRQA